MVATLLGLLYTIARPTVEVSALTLSVTEHGH